MILAIIVACVLMLGTNMIEAQEADQSKTLESAGQPSPVMDVQESPEDVSEGGKGYHPEGRRITSAFQSVTTFCQGSYRQDISSGRKISTKNTA
jgi:hypothetical protein